MKSLDERFWDKVRKTDGCWLWTASVDKWGYGRIQIGSNVLLAHRVALQLSGTFDPDLLALHKCNVPACVRVDSNHVYQGTLEDNVKDALASGTYGRAGLKISVEQARLIQEKYIQGGLTLLDLAIDYNVSESTISRIVRGRWIDTYSKEQ